MKILVDKDFLYEVSVALDDMIDYADDGSLDRDDEDYSDFFESVYLANSILNKLNAILSEDK